MPEKLFLPDLPMNQARCLAVYETLRDVMPPSVEKSSTSLERLRDLFADLDAVLLDGYGVLNIGADIVPGADEMLMAAEAANVEVMVLTNGGSRPARFASEKYRNLGLPLDDRQVISSRDAMEHWLRHNAAPGLTIGVVDSFCTTPDLDRHEFVALSPEDPDTWKQVDAIAFFGAVNWDYQCQLALRDAAQDGVEVLVANPDVAAPHLGAFSFEPGYWAASLTEIPRDQIRWFGKPYAPVFDLALRKLEDWTGRSNLKRDRIAMVGDSLHTDILGGNAAGLKTVRVTDHGLFRDGGAEAAIKSSGINPDVIVKTV